MAGARLTTPDTRFLEVESPSAHMVKVPLGVDDPVRVDGALA